MTNITRSISIADQYSSDAEKTLRPRGRDCPSGIAEFRGDTDRYGATAGAVSSRAFDGKADPRWPDALNQTVAWLARNPKTFDNVVVMETYTPGGNVITGAYAKDFESTTRNAVKPETMSEFSSEPLMISGERSLHYRYKLVRKAAPPLYRFGYVTGMEHKVIVSTSDEKPTEPKWFRQIAISVGWLKVP